MGNARRSSQTVVYSLAAISYARGLFVTSPIPEEMKPGQVSLYPVSELQLDTAHTPRVDYNRLALPAAGKQSGISVAGLHKAFLPGRQP
ncbi:hypothetical protein F5Y00DRAFT_262691 [Daldinia vernicosa]|uniref:uncharacterized protein n=1 Tax=Daldinia vernicosa TaxID=114800 RepID=UPI0020075738|nr:uncharacterized protein F5Y00DRAFT_262691 [Daldinia vernicosa]KAI0848307.1 hypothetical protein F5Y00DRAFT_262691 [Daldinia vernicosa]